MAWLESTKTPTGGSSWRIRFKLQGKRKAVTLGPLPKRTADQILRHVENLIHSIRWGTALKQETQDWMVKVDADMRSRLHKAGLCDAGSETAKINTLGEYLDSYIKSREDLRSSTLVNYKQVRRLLVQKFGEDYPIRSITPGDAARWRRWLVAKKMAPSTVSKHVKRAKTVFKEATQDQLFLRNPFAELKGALEANRERQRFVSREVSELVLRACPDPNWKLIFGLARYGGMRCPSEVTSLKWEDLDVENMRMTVNSSKTGRRQCPLFPELLPLLEEAKKHPAAHPEYCVNRYNKGDNMRTTMTKIIKKAKVEVWPKLFINLRSSRRTELQDKFPSHVIDAWLGHSTRVAEIHYLQVTDSHFEAATKESTGEITDSLHPGANPGLSLREDGEKEGLSLQPEKPCFSQSDPQNTGDLELPDNCRLTLKLEKVTPTGLEKTPQTREIFTIVMNLGLNRGHGQQGPWELGRLHRRLEQALQSAMGKEHSGQE